MEPDGSAPHPRSSRRQFLEATTLATAGVALGCSSTSTPSSAPDAAPPVDMDAMATPDAPPNTPDATRPTPQQDASPDATTDASLPEVEDPIRYPESDNFPLGVASGDVLPTSAMLWTRHDGDLPLEVHVWLLDGETLRGPILTTPVSRADGGFVHHDAEGLTAGAKYRFAFLEVEETRVVARSSLGTFRAALSSESLEPLIVGAVSCTRNGRSMETLERAGERDDIDLFLLLGDTTYNDGASSLSEYRGRWAENMSTAGYRSMRSSTSVLATWDDHEVTNDFNPESVDPSEFDNARTTFFENLPLRRDADAPSRIWKSHRWGNTLEVFVLDTRGERRPSTRRTEGHYISRPQMDWLKAGLRDSPAVFKFLMNSVPISNFPFAFDFASRDRWEGYPRQRDEILEFIDNEPIDGVVWIAGDFHLGCMAQVERSGVGSTQQEFLVGPGAQTANPLWSTLRMPQFSWSTGESNYTTFELNPADRSFRVVYHSGDRRILQSREFSI